MGSFDTVVNQKSNGRSTNSTDQKTLSNNENNNSRHSRSSSSIALFDKEDKTRLIETEPTTKIIKDFANLNLNKDINIGNTMILRRGERIKTFHRKLNIYAVDIHRALVAKVLGDQFKEPKNFK